MLERIEEGAIAGDIREPPADIKGKAAEPGIRSGVLDTSTGGGVGGFGGSGDGSRDG